MPHSVRRALAIVTIMALGLLPWTAPALGAPLVFEPTPHGGAVLSLGGDWDSPCNENGRGQPGSGTGVGVFSIYLESYTLTSDSLVADYDYARIFVCGTLLPSTSGSCTEYIQRPQLAQGTLTLMQQNTWVGETVQLTDIDFSHKDTRGSVLGGAMVFQASAVLADGRAVDVHAQLKTSIYPYDVGDSNCWGVDRYQRMEDHRDAVRAFTVVEAT